MYSLKCKYTMFHRRKIPRGDPSMPADALLTKNLRVKMTERAYIGDGGDEVFFPDAVTPLPINSSDDAENYASVSGEPTISTLSVVGFFQTQSLTTPSTSPSHPISTPPLLVHRRPQPRK